MIIDEDQLDQMRFRKQKPSSNMAGTQHQHTAHYWVKHRLREMADVDRGLEHMSGVTLYGCSGRVSAKLGQHLHADLIMMGAHSRDFWRHYGLGMFKLSPTRNDNLRPGWDGRWIGEHFVQYAPDEAPDWFHLRR